MTPTDIKSQWRESWKSAPVVSAHLVDAPTIRQPGFTLPRQQWSLLSRFCTSQGHCGACRTNTDLCSCGETTSSNPALLWSWTVVCPSFSLLMLLLLPGWPTMGLNRIRKKKNQLELGILLLQILIFSFLPYWSSMTVIGREVAEILWCKMFVCVPDGVIWHLQRGPNMLGKNSS